MRKRRTFSEHARESVTSNASAFGYSVALTVTFAIVDAGTSPTDAFHVLLFALGAGLGFPAIEVTASMGFRRKLRDVDRDVEIIGASFSLFAILLSIGAAWLLTWLLPNNAAWLVSPFFATIAYVLGDGIQMGMAEWVERRLKEGQEADPED